MKEELYSLATDKINGVIPSLFKAILWPLSLIYACCVRMILFFYRRNICKAHKLDCRVISVGNITLGGTAKTPLAELIARHLRQEGSQAGILTRGYKRNKKSTDNSGYKSRGDEPYMLSLNNPGVPIGIGRDRVKVGRKLAADNNLDTVILDDGFQHWRLYRDLDIVTIDASYPFGNRNMIPRGILREPISSLARAGIFMITKSDSPKADLTYIKNTLQNINPDALIAESVFIPDFLYDINQLESREAKEKIYPANIKDKKACIVSSIANPDYFAKIVADMGFDALLKFYFLDHHDYKAHELAIIFDACLKKDIKAIITTEKDAVKLKELCASRQGVSILVLRIELKITKNEEEFSKRLSNLYKR